MNVTEDLARVSVYHNPQLRYTQDAPFHPSTRHPEYPWPWVAGTPTNAVYDGVRACLAQLGLDAARVDSPEWNPFGIFIKPGDTVLVKPNVVLHQEGTSDQHAAIVTNAGIVRAIIDYVVIAMQKRGKIIIGDAPVLRCQIQDVLRNNGLDAVMAFVRANSEIDISFVDLREESIQMGKHGEIIKRQRHNVPYVSLYIGTHSKLEEIIQDAHLFAVESYPRKLTVSSHEPGRHIYDINKVVYDVDAIINIPKLKTHKKAGITGAVKSFVGLNANKWRLPHYRFGCPANGGDEYPVTNALREIYRKGLDVLAHCDSNIVRLPIIAALYLGRRIFSLTKFPLVVGGSWSGNDTLWRTICDINKAVYFGDAEGIIHKQLQRNVFHLVDGVIAGEGQGPMNPTAKQAGLILAGFNPFLIDAVACEMMGFDHTNVKSVNNAGECFGVGVDEATVVLNGDALSFSDVQQRINMQFKPARFWDNIVRREA